MYYYLKPLLLKIDNHVVALAVACVAAVAPINAQSGDKAATVTLIIEGMT